MIKVLVKTNTLRREVVADVSSTPIEVLSNVGVGTSGSVVNLNGTILTVTDLNSAFSALGTADGATVNLNCIVKADGAM